MLDSTIMVVLGEVEKREKLKDILSDEGYKVRTAYSALKAIEYFNLNPTDMVITNLNLPDHSGLEVLGAIKKISPQTPVLILAKNSTVEVAVDAMKLGACDFLIKPSSNEAILLSVKKNVNTKNSNPCNTENYITNTNQWKEKKIITSNKVMISLLEQAKKIAGSNAPVLIQGESGTGKELFAAYIVNNSGRDKKLYFAMNCAALPENLAESELFGHEKGAFTGAFKRKIGKFEQAHRGTLLLDEISELNLNVQAKLLRVLQEKLIERLGGVKSVFVDTRIVATCNVPLEKAVKDKMFRKDLFYRVNVITFTIPPLRERKEDIPLLTEFFVEKFSKQNFKNIREISSNAMNCLCSHNWPGNVRELENVIERSVLICDNNTILPEHLFLQKNESIQDNDISVGTTVKDMEKKLILKTLKHLNDNRTHAAQMLGISIRTLRNKLREYYDEKIHEFS